MMNNCDMTIIETFSELCKMSQVNLKKYLANKLTETHKQVITKDGFVFAQGEFPVLLVAHLDTVHKELPKIFEYDRNKDILSSPNGIGGDDRCGVYMILEIIKRYNCSVLFCEDEEIGGIGADKFTKDKLIDELEFNYILEFDRMGNNDAVFYDCDNPDFEKFITKDFYKSNWGTFSDISVIAPVIGCAAVNLSCGYYKAHTKDEYVVLYEMEESIEAACKILERTTDNDKFEYLEAMYKYNNDYYRYSFLGNTYLIGYFDENNQEQWVQVDALSKIEAIGKFCMEHPTVPYEDINYVWEDELY